jgi:hypothetical protein
VAFGTGEYVIAFLTDHLVFVDACHKGKGLIRFQSIEILVYQSHAVRSRLKDLIQFKIGARGCLLRLPAFIYVHYHGLEQEKI